MIDWVYEMAHCIGGGNRKAHYPTLIRTADSVIDLTYTHTGLKPKRETSEYACFGEFGRVAGCFEIEMASANAL